MEDCACRNARRLKLAAQRGERGAESVAPGIYVCVRPEQIDQDLARVAPFQMVGQKGQERSRFPGAESRDDAPVYVDAQFSKQFDEEWCHHGGNELSTALLPRRCRAGGTARLHFSHETAYSFREQKGSILYFEFRLFRGFWSVLRTGI
jgi:hypothetical protein